MRKVQFWNILSSVCCSSESFATASISSFNEFKLFSFNEPDKFNISVDENSDAMSNM